MQLHFLWSRAPTWLLAFCVSSICGWHLNEAYSTASVLARTHIFYGYGSSCSILLLNETMQCITFTGLCFAAGLPSCMSHFATLHPQPACADVPPLRTHRMNGRVQAEFNSLARTNSIQTTLAISFVLPSMRVPTYPSSIYKYVCRLTPIFVFNLFWTLQKL